jgi:hypothetical protein
MKRASLIAAGLLAFGLTAARAEVGKTGSSSGTTVTVEPVSPPSNVDVNVKTPPGSDVDVTVNPAQPNPTPPSAGAPGEPGNAPPGSVDVNVTPQATVPPAPVAPKEQSSVQPPARIIDANTAAIFGGVTEATVPVQPMPQPGYYRHSAVRDTSHTWVGRLGTGLLVGGGYEDFTNNNLQSMTGSGGTWNARAIAGTRQFIGVEAAYVGAARGVNALGVQSDAVLVSNGAEGALRLNIPVVMRSRQLLEPFGFVGVGWSRYQITNTNVNTSSLAGNDNIMSVPMGGGLEYAIGRFMADARFTYRATYYNDLMRTGGNLNNWGVSTQVGVSF